MTETRPAATLDGDGPGAPPRSNGELVFEAPWQGRVFGLVMALCEAGRLEYEDFRAELIAAIGEAEHGGRPGDGGFSYYGCWLLAAERVLGRQGIVDDQALRRRLDALAARPHGHDHPHGTEHG